MLVEKWRFPADLVETIRYQYGPEIKDTPHDRLCLCRQPDQQEAANSALPATPASNELPPAIAQRLGGTLDELIVSLGDLAPLLEEAKIFSKV